MKTVAKAIVNVPVGLCALILAMSQGASAQGPSPLQLPASANRVSQSSAPDIAIALPIIQDLPGFGGYEVTRINDREVLVKAVRKSDGLQLEVELFGCPDETAADRVFAGYDQLSSVRMLETSWSGTKLSPKVRRSKYRGDVPMGTHSLILQDGRTVMRVRLTGPFRRNAKGEAIRDANGEYIQYRFTDADLLYAESIAQQVLQRMTALGLGSKPASEATARAKQEIQERRQVPAPTNPQTP